jgi:hypothetical protein
MCKVRFSMTIRKILLLKTREDDVNGRAECGRTSRKTLLIKTSEDGVTERN